MKAKGFGCYSCTRAEFLEAMREPGAVAWTGKFGPHMQSGGRELHPRRKTFWSLIESGVLKWLPYLNETQKALGLRRCALVEVENGW